MKKRMISDMKSIVKDKKLKIEELQNQINEIKNRREQNQKVKEMIFRHFENINNTKKELDDLKIRNLISEIQDKAINDIIPFIVIGFKFLFMRKRYKSRKQAVICACLHVNLSALLFFL